MRWRFKAHRDTWRRLLLRGVHFSDRHRQLDFLYRVEDPWQLDCARERYRFQAVNEIIRREFGEPIRIIEVGCGEGLQSSYLIDVCKHLHGIDISSTAIARARKRCPAATFEAGDISAGLQPRSLKTADLAVACEVIYYVKNPDRFLNALSGLGRACLISYYTAHRGRLDPLLASRPCLGRELIRFEETEWIAAWWRNGD